MKTMDCVVVVLAACITAAIALALREGMPGALADDSPPGKAVARGQILETEGVQLSLEVCYPEGHKKPMVRLKAVNTGSATSSVGATISMFTVKPPSPLARALPAPRQVWSTPVDLTLESHQIRTVEVPVAAAVGAGTRATFRIQAGGKSIVAASLFVPPAPGTPAPGSLVVLQQG